MRALQGKIFAVVESTLPRAIDVVLVIMLLRKLEPEVVGSLETAQAIAAPLMLLFLSPEQILYRDLSEWKTAGPRAHLPRLHSLRHFCWLKGLGGLVLAGLLSLRQAGPDTAIFCAFLWAFSRVLAPQVIGIDREYLRISGKTGRALTLVLTQKFAFLAGAAIAVFALPGRAAAGLATAGAASVLGSAILARLLSRERGDTLAGTRVRLGAILREAVTRFSFWSHVAYVSAVTVESLDVMALGTMGVARRAVGIYGAAVRVANFSFALPTAIYTWFGMRIGQAGKNEEIRTSPWAARRTTLWLLAVSVVQTAALCAAAPWIARVLGSARWTELERAQFATYLPALALGAGFYTLTYGIMTWLKLVRDVRSLVFRIFVPWLAVSGALYFHFASRGELASLAWSNVASYGSYAVLIALFQVGGQHAKVRARTRSSVG